MVQRNSGRKEDDLRAVGGRPPTGGAGALQTVLQAMRLRELSTPAAGEAFRWPTCSNRKAEQLKVCVCQEQRKKTVNLRFLNIECLNSSLSHLHSVSSIIAIE